VFSVIENICKKEMRIRPGSISRPLDTRQLRYYSSYRL